MNNPARRSKRLARQRERPMGLSVAVTRSCLALLACCGGTSSPLFCTAAATGEVRTLLRSHTIADARLPTFGPPRVGADLQRASVDVRMGLGDKKLAATAGGDTHLMRFAGTQQAATRKASVDTEAEGSIGPCSCEFIPPDYESCAPKSALCMLCMSAAYNDYWHPDIDVCEPYIKGAQDMCKKVAGAVKGKAKKELESMYTAYGPNFGASAVYCRQGGCCLEEAG